MTNIALDDSLEFVLGRQPLPKEGLSKHYKLLINELWNEYSHEVIEKLLENPGSTVASDGLMILSEIGERGKPGTDLALLHVGHPDWTARFYLADHLLSCNAFLSVSQISKSLRLASDSKEDVRCKMMELFSRLDSTKVVKAVNLNTEINNPDLHKKGCDILLSKSFSSDDFSKIYQQSEPTLITYSGGRLLRDWREGLNSEPINISPDHYDIAYLERRYKKLVAANAGHPH